MKKKNAVPQGNSPQTASLVEKETTIEEVAEAGIVSLPKKEKAPKAPKVEEVPVVEEVAAPAVEEVKAEEEVVDPATY
jgi:hypothetical protein